jgi:hypothetical protein
VQARRSAETRAVEPFRTFPLCDLEGTPNGNSSTGTCGMAYSVGVLAMCTPVCHVCHVYASVGWRLYRFLVTIVNSHDRKVYLQSTVRL